MKEIEVFIKKFGLNLSKSGMDSYAFKKNDAIEFIYLLKKYDDILIYGGDFLIYEHEKFIHTYDNWYYDGNNSLESIELALNEVKIISKKTKLNFFVNIVYENEGQSPS